MFSRMSLKIFSRFPVGFLNWLLLRHVLALPIIRLFVNQSNILSIPPLNCPKTATMSDKQEYEILSSAKLAKSRSSIS